MRFGRFSVGIWKGGGGMVVTDCFTTTYSEGGKDDKLTNVFRQKAFFYTGYLFGTGKTNTRLLNRGLDLKGV